MGKIRAIGEGKSTESSEKTVLQILKLLWFDLFTVVIEKRHAEVIFFY